MKTICFDLDGTLTDPKIGITKCIQYALIDFIDTAPDASDLLWCIGPPLLQSFETLLGNKKDALKALAKYRERFSDIGIYENKLYPGIPEALSALKQRGYRLIVATSKPEIFATKIIDHFALSQYFTDICGSELNGNRADKTELLFWILQRHQIDHTRATMIGDRSHDIIGAINNKIRAIGVTYGYGSKNELIDTGAYGICHSPQEICDFFE